MAVKERMIVPCTLCDKQMDTKNEEAIVTVGWVYSDLLKRNNIKSNKSIPRVVKLCKKCWEEALKDKPQEDNYHWSFNKTI